MTHQYNADAYHIDMSKFIICYGDVRSDPALVAKWEQFIKSAMQSPHWCKVYDTWNPGGTDCGWMSSQNPNGVEDSSTGAVVLAFMTSNGFTRSATAWGATRYDAVDCFSPPADVKAPNANASLTYHSQLPPISDRTLVYNGVEL